MVVMAGRGHWVLSVHVGQGGRWLLLSVGVCASLGLWAGLFPRDPGDGRFSELLVTVSLMVSPLG